MNRGPIPGRAAVDHIAKVKIAWGDDTPEWIVALAEACNRSSQSAVAKDLGYSGPVISQVLSNKYQNGDLTRVEQMVRGALMAETIICPIMGEMARDVCQSWQKKPFGTASSHRVRMYTACRSGCPHSRISTNRSEVDDAL
ncbi:transcriptional regulator (plasmid) [Rhizobium lusitanum]|uniref:transcriptional regulator n=1 Tax=Rhizobium lusitanum TaxID=293958 RepID=UPI001612DBCA|nr:transcriptional regulator [Rhizobium lusitanum]QND45232.1 transcriptional regulator [Rhizobium lusitanum]